MKMFLSLAVLAIAVPAFACDAVTAASYQTQAVAANPCQVLSAAPVQYQSVQVVRVAQPVYQVRQVAVVQAQPHYVQNVQVVRQQKFVAVQNGYGGSFSGGQRFSQGNVRAGGGGNVLNTLLSPQGVLTIGGAALGASVAGPGGAAIGAAVGQIVGGGLR